MSGTVEFELGERCEPPWHGPATHARAFEALRPLYASLGEGASLDYWFEYTALLKREDLDITRFEDLSGGFFLPSTRPGESDGDGLLDMLDRHLDLAGHGEGSPLYLPFHEDGSGDSLGIASLGHGFEVCSYHMPLQEITGSGLDAVAFFDCWARCSFQEPASWRSLLEKAPSSGRWDRQELVAELLL